MKTGLLRQSVIALLLRLSSAAVAYIGIMLLGRWLAPRDYGLFGSVISLLAFAAAVTGMGMPQSMLRFVGEYRARGDMSAVRGTFRTSTGLVARFSITIASAGAMMGAFLIFCQRTEKLQDVGWIAFGLILLPPFISIEFHGAVLRGYDKLFSALAPRELIWRLAMIPIGFSVSIWFAPGQQFAPFLLAAAAVLWATAILQAWSTWRLLGRMHAEDEPHRDLIQTSRNIWLSDIASFGFNNIDVVAVALFLSSKEAGLYFVASRTASLVSFTLNAVNTVLGPRLSAAYFGNDYGCLERTARMGALMAFTPAFCLFLGITLFGEQLLACFGPVFPSAKPILVILASAQLINAMVGSCGLLLLMTGHQALIARISMGWFLFGAILMVLLALVYSSMGIAIAVAIAISGNELTLWFVTRRVTGIDASILSLLR